MKPVSAVIPLLVAALCLPAPLGAQGIASAPRVTEQASGVTTLLQAAHAVNPEIVWASGHGGAVVRTLDGGRSWERLILPSGDPLEFRDVHALGADTAWVLSAGAGAKSRIYRTTNGGREWTLQFINGDSTAFYDCFTMFDRDRGVAFSDASNGRTNIRTVDGGANWRLLGPDSVPAPLPGERAFAASGLCVVHADASTAFIATGPPGARLFRSNDGGASWQALETPFVRGRVAGLTGLSFASARRGIAVAADIDRLRGDTSTLVVGVTDDGGLTWSMRARPPLAGALAGIAWVPGAGADVAVAVGFGGAFYTTDGARGWQTLTSDVYTGVAAAGSRAWITGANGRIVRLDW
jgi:photosystem II stability/assembly factor-like uncharacterized protein